VAEVLYNENPSITDSVVFEFLTPDATGCLLQMPYRVNNFIIYFVERDFTSGNTSEYEEVKYDTTKLALAEAAEALACSDPTAENITNAKTARANAENSIISSSFYFNQATPIQIVGTQNFPAWLGHTITGISAANPSQITTESNHYLTSGDKVYIYASNSDPVIDGLYEVTVTGPNTFTIEYDLSGGSAGSSGVWMTLQQNTDNALTPVLVDGETVIGLFKYVWQPLGAREGDYFVCWTWTPIAGSSTLSSHIKFSLTGNTQVTTSLPSHFTNPEKYPTLLERYTPEMFKMYMTNDDVTPVVLDKFNESVAAGFTTLENLANQIVDLQDANTIHEALLPYLSNIFNLKLKTSDPTRWRGQIKRAIPQFKRKGTKGGLEEAFEHASMKLLNFKRIWQIKSKYTWQESFVCTGPKDFILEKELYGSYDPVNMELYLKTEHLVTAIEVYIPDPVRTKITCFSDHGLNSDDEIYIYNSNSNPVVDGTYKVTVDSPNTFIINKDISGGTEGTYALWHSTVLDNSYQELTPVSSYVNFATVDGVTTMSWISTSTPLRVGDIVRIIYQVAAVPSPLEQGYENHVRDLPLIDQRDESQQIFPLKNWNVRALPEDDPLFDILIPTRHPFHDFLVFGKIRTEFPYSENIYNMEEYNGSIRNSKNPCDIDRSFIDPCQYCISSSYNIDVEVEKICDDRIDEFYEVIRENVPFHAVLHTVNFYGSFDELLAPPIETIECYIKIKGSEIALAGEGQFYFNRSMDQVYSSLDLQSPILPNFDNSLGIFRGSANTWGKQSLVDLEAELVDTQSGLAFNDDVLIYNIKSMERLRINESGNASVKITTGPYAGTYQVLDIDKQVVKIDPTPLEPIEDCNEIFKVNGELSDCTFHFRIFNVIIDISPYSSLCDIIQENYITLSDSKQNWGELGLQTVLDVTRGTATATWTIELVGYGTYNILDITTQGNLVVEYDNATLFPVTSGDFVYKIYDDAANEVTLNGSSPHTGYLTVKQRAKVEVLNTSLRPITNIIKNDNFWQKIGAVEYKIIEVLTTDTTYDYFFIDGYNLGSAAGVHLIVYERILDNQIGYMSHRGLNVEVAGIDLESNHYIQNGENQYRWDGDGTPNMSADPILPNPDPLATPKFVFKENFIVVVDDGSNEDSYWMTYINGNNSGNTLLKLSGNDHYWQTYGQGGTPVTVKIYRYTSKGADIIGQVFDQPDHQFRYITRSGSVNVTAEEGAYYTWTASVRDVMISAVPYSEDTTKTLVTTRSMHNLHNSQKIFIYETNASPSIDGEYQITVVDDTNFLINLDITGGTSASFGFWHRIPTNGSAFSDPEANNATKLLISYYDGGGLNQTSMLSSWTSPGYMHFVDSTDTVVSVFQITGTKVPYTRYYEIPVDLDSGTNPIEGQRYRIFYAASPSSSSIVTSLANKPKSDGPEDFIKQKEAVSYKIEYVNGSEEKGEL